MMQKKNNFTPLISTLILFWILFLFILKLSLQQTGGNVVYTQDDVYIHMAMAKNFVQYQVWGVTQYHFSSTSSSVLYTLILAALFSIFGISDLIPLIFNLIVANLLLILIDRILVKENVFEGFRLITGFLLIICTPLIPVIFTGMEHILHALINILFFYEISHTINDIPAFNIKIPKKYSEKMSQMRIQRLICILLAACLTSVRYEGMFAVILCIFFCVFYRKVYFAFYLLIVGFLPVFIYGIISVAHGWFFFPNSIMIKGNVEGIFAIFSNITLTEIFIRDQLWILSLQYHIYPFLAFLGMIGVMVWYKTKNNKAPEILFSTFYLAGSIFQAFFAKFSQFYRYDAFLMSFAIFTIGYAYRHISITWDSVSNTWSNYWEKMKMKVNKKDVSIFESLTKESSNLDNKITNKDIEHNPISTNKQTDSKILGIICISLLIFTAYYPAINRGLGGMDAVSLATKNIYEQQYQMAHFLHRYYSGVTITANDIGAMNFYGDLQCFDLCGLGDIEPATNVLQGGDWRARLYDIVKEKNIQIAVVYNVWFSSSNWTRVATWQITNNIVCGYDIVTFYAINSSAAIPMKQNLKYFQSDLPSTVLVQYFL